MNNEQAQKFEKEVALSVDKYSKDLVDDHDLKGIKQLQGILRSQMGSLDDEVQDIERMQLNLRTRLIAWLLQMFVSNEDTVFAIQAQEKPLSFTMEVDIPWEPDTVIDIEGQLRKAMDARLDRAWHMYKVSIDENQSRMTFYPVSS